MPAGLGAYPLILERPWLWKVKAIQNWKKAVIFVFTSSGQKMSFDMLSRAEITSSNHDVEEDGYDSDARSEETESSTTSESDEADVAFMGMDDMQLVKNVAEVELKEEEDKYDQLGCGGKGDIL